MCKVKYSDLLQLHNFFIEIDCNTEMNHILRTFYPVRDCILVALKPFSPIFMPRGAA